MKWRRKEETEGYREKRGKGVERKIINIFKIKK
jgi:hypothetical protein